jgi:NADPH:quinone reductase-like Zn-dependent oxidoreductase
MRHDIASTVSFQKRHDAIRVRRIMQAIRVRHFGGIDSLVFEEVPRPDPGEGEVLLRGKAAGVGPWDALVRAGRSVLPQPLPLAPGSDVSGVVERVGRGVSQFKEGDAVFGATRIDPFLYSSRAAFWCPPLRPPIRRRRRATV